ncbi:unnamed protein product, partial [marine sediment metagenome]
MGNKEDLAKAVMELDEDKSYELVEELIKDGTDP